MTGCAEHDSPEPDIQELDACIGAQSVTLFEQFAAPGSREPKQFGQALPGQVDPQVDQNLSNLGKHRTLTGDYRLIANYDYAKFLNQWSFHWFCTFTFKESRHPEAADKLFRVWINDLNISIYGKQNVRKRGHGVFWVRALEWQKRGVIHYHVLLAFENHKSLKQDFFSSLTRVSYALKWRDELDAGIAKIDDIKGDQQKVTSYLTKYVTKDGELDFSRNFERLAIAAADGAFQQCAEAQQP